MVFQVRFPNSKNNLLFVSGICLKLLTKLCLTKSRYNLLKRANDHVKEVPSIKISYADINCRLKVKFNDEKEKDIFFSSFH